MFAKVKKLLVLFLIFSLFLLGAPVLLTHSRALFGKAETSLIRSVDELTAAIVNAKEGDTVLVDDITFNPMPTGMIILSKNVTIKSGKATNAVFSNVTFAVNGSSVETPALSVRFENIDFRGDRAGKPVDLNDSAAVSSKLPDMMKTMCAAIFKMNVNATYAGCTFEGYHYGYGGVFSAIYSSKDNENTLNLCLDDCTFKNNASKLGGGIYLSGYNHNVHLNARRCVFNENAASSGGAIWADYADVKLQDCEFIGNQFLDTGWASSNGGALALYDCDAEIDGCLIANNTSGGNGGGIFCEIAPFKGTVLENCTLSGNTALSDQGISIALSQTNYDTRATAHIYFSSLLGKQDLAGNAELTACLLVDEKIEKAEPNKENGYCLTLDVDGAQKMGLSFGEPKHVLSPKGEYPVPEAELENIAGGKFLNSWGKLQVGDNYVKEVTFKIQKTPSEVVTVTKAYGEELSLEPPQRKGYAFEGWEYPDGAAVESALFIGGELPEGVITARWRFVLAENLYVIWLPCVALVVIAAGAFAFYKAKKQKAQVSALAAESEAGELSAQSTESTPLIVKAWFTKEEIDTIVSSLPKVQTLTVREVEVLVEVLQGKRQKEIAYDLGIKITTVKDFYRKIYDKLEVENKEDLFTKCSKLLTNA